ncbi:hypothetical protein Hanom_Chr01g00080491 [Helianthus anomalus]
MLFRLKMFSFESPLNFCDVFQASNVQFDPLHNICCVYDEKIPKMANFKSILEFMKRLPIQKALTNQHLVFGSHNERFWENETYNKKKKNDKFDCELERPR